MRFSKLFFFCIILFNQSQAQVLLGAKKVSVSNPSDSIEISGMPKVRSQDSTGLCYSFVASTLLDRQTCMDLRRADCENLDDSLRASPLDVARYKNDPDKGSDPNIPDSYQGISSGGKIAITLEHALRSSQMVSEQCAPFHQFVATHKDFKQRSMLELSQWRRLQDLYEKYNDLKCPTCDNERVSAVEDLRQNFGIQTSNEEILRAFGEKTFAIFLDRILISDECRLLGTTGVTLNYKVKEFPIKALSADKSGYEKTIEKIKEVLKTQTPMGVSFCVEKEISRCVVNNSPEMAGESHAVIIKGYRRVCKSKDKSSCYDAIQIQNSWGQQWQTENNDGWVDAKELLDRTRYLPGALTWLSK